ncbi:BRF1-domain-containing protein [Mycena albidolilacea]|uniref:B-related factor 1 n=1 Tax=Mycena albidolilacea TaxID=1033008 RepID=A0AAD6ZQY4_9AGAR|nr:BRF1-domain-containing protein [Mycena albidolilacea]
MPSCKDCGGTVLEYDTAAGNGVCVACGMVVEENAIVSEITFGETSSGGAMVQGSFVGQGATHARMSGPYGNRGNSDSRAQTIENASKKINMISSVLRLSEAISNSALRLYTLAVEQKFTKGRKSMNVVAVCLYISCRQKDQYTHMLIDFSDLLQVNVFELGHTYLQLVQTLHIRLPLVDPSHYISRFAALLEFGDETPKVSMDAVRLVQRFDRDWMTRGRRPAGICGAALLLAARMNNFRRSVEEIVQVVKIADTTLKKRLDEFKNTPSGALTLSDFRSVWLDAEVDPPAYTRNKVKEEAERVAAEEAAAEAAELAATGVVKEKPSTKGKKKKKGKGKGKRKREDDDEADLEASNPDGNGETEAPRQPLDPAILNDGILAGTSEPLFLPDLPEDPNANIDPALLSQSFPPVSSSATAVAPHSPSLPPIETALSEVLTEEVSTFLQNPQGAMLSSALDEAHERRLAQITVVDELLGLNEEELDRFILTDEEVKIKERVWVELNKDYLEALAAKGDVEQAPKPKKRRKNNESSAPRDTSNPAGNTAAESVKNLLNKSHKYSKRINYDALRHLLVEGPSLDEKDDDQLYTLDDKSDGEGMSMLVIEEAPGTVVSAPPPKPKPKKALNIAARVATAGNGNVDVDGDEDMDPEEGSDKGEDVGWEDAYEQEV